MASVGTNYPSGAVLFANTFLVNREILNWLMDGDPAIRYQTQRDLVVSETEDLVRLQDEIANSGWGAKLLALQASDGRWGGGIYGPKWISTHYTLMLLMRLGLSPSNDQAIRGTKILLDNGFYADGGINHFASMNHGEVCVTAMTLSLASYFDLDDDRVFHMKDFLLDLQMEDGGWNCEYHNGAIHSSLHTTISVLEALRIFTKRFPKDLDEISAYTARAHEFILMHHLFKSDKTGAIIDDRMTRFSFPPRWKYDIMRSLDYFQDVNAPHDPRFCDAITILKRKEKNGKWPVQQKHTGLVHFDLEKTGTPSRINTVRALRILNWWKSKPGEIQCSDA